MSERLATGPTKHPIRRIFENCLDLIEGKRLPHIIWANQEQFQFWAELHSSFDDLRIAERAPDIMG